MALDLEDKDYSPGQITKSTWDVADNAVRTKIIGAIEVEIDPDGLATEAKQDDEIAAVVSTGSNTVTAISDASNEIVAAIEATALTTTETSILYSYAVPVTTGAYVEIVSSTLSTFKEVEIFDSSGQTLALATGDAASEIPVLYIIPGGNGRVPLQVPTNTRLSLVAISDDATEGYIVINFYG